MLRLFRAVSATWPARLFFLALAAGFVYWGVAARNPFGGDPTAAATVGGTPITAQALQEAYRRNLAQATRQSGSNDLPPGLRQQVATQTLQQLVTQMSLQQMSDRLGLAVADAALLDTAHGFAAFHNKDGAYDPAIMQRVLQSNGLTEQRFLQMLRDDQRQEQLMAAVAAGAAAPKPLADAIFRLQHEARVADVVDFAFADAPQPAAPDEAQLRRWYDNHPSRFMNPEYRRIRAVILDADSIAHEVPVTDEELRAAYTQHQGEFTQPERRSVQVLSIPDEAAAQRLAAQWSTGTDWETMRKAAEAAGGAATELSAATRAEFPAPELAEAAFATGAETVSPPVHGALGWYVVRVSRIDAGGAKPFEAVRDQLRERLAADRAADLIDQRATQLDSDLASGRTLDDPLAGSPIAEAGTLDAEGKTPSGEPAPLRGTPSLRAALIAEAFRAHKGDPLKLQRVAPETPRGLPSYYAVEVDEVSAPALKPYDQVADAVRADYLTAARRRAQDAAATKLMAAVQDGTSLADAARAAGVSPRRLPPVTRAGGVEGVPEEVARVLFQMRKGEATMVETPAGFTVAVLADITVPDSASDPVAARRVQEQMDRQVAQDLQSSFATAARERARPQVNYSVVQSLVQGGG